MRIPHVRCCCQLVQFAQSNKVQGDLMLTTVQEYAATVKVRVQRLQPR